MWESPESLWGRLKLGREEFLQRLVTTLIVGGDAPRWNTQTRPSDQGMRFLRLLDGLAHGDDPLDESAPTPDAFVDEYLLPKLEESAENGWPDWAVLWLDRVPGIGSLMWATTLRRFSTRASVKIDVGLSSSTATGAALFVRTVWRR